MICDFNFQNILQYGQSQTINSEITFLIDYITIANKLFTWKNLPAEIPQNIMEFNLFANGRLVFFKDDNLGYMCLPTGGFGKINNYGLPTEYIAIGMTGYTKRLSMDDAILIKNDPLYMPCYWYVLKMCKRMANIWEAIGVNINACKTPFVAYGDKSEVLNFKNAYKKINDNEPLICYNSDRITTPFNILNTNAQYFGDKFSAQLMDTENKILTYLGINNVNIEKRERVNTDEVNSNNEIINYHLFERLAVRQEACEEINKMFGLNVSVEINKDYINNELINDLKNTRVGEVVNG